MNGRAKRASQGKQTKRGRQTAKETETEREQERETMTTPKRVYTHPLFPIQHTSNKREREKRQTADPQRGTRPNDFTPVHDHIIRIRLTPIHPPTPLPFVGEAGRRGCVFLLFIESRGGGVRGPGRGDYFVSCAIHRGRESTPFRLILPYPTLVWIPFPPQPPVFEEKRGAPRRPRP